MKFKFPFKGIHAFALFFILASSIYYWGLYKDSNNLQMIGVGFGVVALLTIVNSFIDVK